jgi:hypothetical protein
MLNKSICILHINLTEKKLWTSLIKIYAIIISLSAKKVLLPKT